MTLQERLAEYAHSAWSGWTRYMFDVATVNGDGSVTIPKVLVDRWTRQLRTAYADLPEDEKRSDRDEAMKIMAALEEAEEPDDGRFDVQL